MTRRMRILIGISLLALCAQIVPGTNAKTEPKQTWSQWRGPGRDGKVAGPRWPERINNGNLDKLWRVELAPSYSGPIVSETAVFVTETKDKSTEIVRALDRATGREIWKTEWAGAISVPFFAKSRGDWIRATPAYDGKTLYVAGMRDVLIALDARTGAVQWRIDFVKEHNAPVPDFGQVCSPLVDGDFVYMQAANAVVKINKKTGKTVWRSFENGKTIMESGAFSSPIIAEVAGRRQLIVQSREELAGLDLESGAPLWQLKVPSFRGMNILTPVVFGDSIFTSSYQNKSWLFNVSRTAGAFSVAEAWNNTAQGYMSTPVVIDGYAYLHLANQRMTCIDLKTGERTWTSKPYGKYWSMVAQGDRILALDEQGRLLLIKANPKEFELIDEVQVSDDECWAHLAIVNDEIFIRELRAMTALRWNGRKDLSIRN